VRTGIQALEVLVGERLGVRLLDRSSVRSHPFLNQTNPSPRGTGCYVTHAILIASWPDEVVVRRLVAQLFAFTGYCSEAAEIVVLAARIAAVLLVDLLFNAPVGADGKVVVIVALDHRSGRRISWLPTFIMTLLHLNLFLLLLEQLLLVPGGLTKRAILPLPALLVSGAAL